MRIPALLVLLSLLCFMGPVQAMEDNLPERLVQIRLIPEKARIEPGGGIRIGIEQLIEPGWHTYWKNPGDSGVPPRVEWTLPEGFSAGEILWPAPHRLPYGPLLNYGYSDHAVLLQTIKAPGDFRGGVITLSAAIDVLVCKEECIPESGVYEITLNNDRATKSESLDGALALVPEEAPWKVTYNEKGGDLRLHLKDAAGEFADAEFFPAEWGLVENTATATVEREGDHSVLKQARGTRLLTETGNFEGVVTYSENGARRAYSFTARPGPAENKIATLPAADENAPMELWRIMILAVLGGLVLNLMPCVFPVLSIKALSLVEAVNRDCVRVRWHGISYTAGVMLSFIAMAGVLIALRAGGTQIGWGFQLQNALVIGGLAYLFLLIGLSLLGLFEIGGRFANAGSHFTRGEGYRHSFFTGVLATLVATPCTAPFMGVAIGYALVQPAAAALAVFAALGFGLALPYLFLSFVPALQKILPRPGHWMETFRQALSFPMLASAAWLVWVLAQQTDEMAVLKILLGGLLLAFALWALRQITLTRAWRFVKIIVVVAAVGGAVYLLPWPASHNETQFGEAFSTQKLDEYLGGNNPIFTEMTAAWCITCKFNHATSIDIESTRKAFADHNVKYLIGDWTNEDPAITEYLKKYGRSGVPLYVYYGPREAGGENRPEAKILPQVLTPGLVTSTLDN
ncbi:MAG: protein-disulfide reductase DsbD family protein [Alphaproteobacteria bacterium]